MDIKQKVGIRIKQLRVERNLSQKKLSHLCELDRTYIASVEKGKRNISIVNIERIARTFELSVYDFFNADLFRSRQKGEFQ